MRGSVVPLQRRTRLETLRQIGLLLERENRRLITNNLELTAELARLRGLPAVEQLAFAVEHKLQQTRTTILAGAAAADTAPAPSGAWAPPRPRCRSSTCGMSCPPTRAPARRAAAR